MDVLNKKKTGRSQSRSLGDLRVKIMKSRTEVSCDQTTSKLWQTILNKRVTKAGKINFDLTWKWALMRSATLPYGIRGVTNHTLLRVSYQTSLETIYKRGFDKLEKTVPPCQQQRLQGSAECWHVEIVSSFPPEVNWFNQFSRNQNHQNFSNLSKPHD